MPKYFCPVITCNRTFEGSLDDIIPPAIGHAAGSHNIEITDEDVIAIIQEQANPNYQKQPRKIKSNLQTNETEKAKWWKKMEKP